MKSTTRKTILNIITTILPTTLLALVLLPTTQAQPTPPWDQIHKLHAADGARKDIFGHSVAISGNLAVIGAGDVHSASSSAYVFNVTTGNQLFKLIPDDGLTSGNFGTSVAASGNLAVIGAPYGDGNVLSSGTAYVFDITTGQQLFKLSALDGEFHDQFGSSVAVSGNLAVSGAPNNGPFGSAYVFDVTTGRQLFNLTPSDGAYLDYFGLSVALDGNLAVIGAKAKAYIFDLTTGQQLFKLTKKDGDGTGLFGNSVAISGNLAVIGAYLDNDNGKNSGSAYVFNATTGQQLYKLLADNGASDNLFGFSVAVDGNLAVIGAIDATGNTFFSGSAYAFDVTNGKQIFKLMTPDGRLGDNLGSSVAIQGNVTVIGAYLDDDLGKDSGSAYVFRQRTTNFLNISPDPLIGSQDGTFSIVQTLPNEQTWLLYSLKGLGQNFISQLNVSIELSKPMIAAGPQLTDANGDLQITINMPGTTDPVNVWFQTVQDNNVTNFIETQLIP